MTNHDRYTGEWGTLEGIIPWYSSPEVRYVPSRQIREESVSAKFRLEGDYGSIRIKSEFTFNSGVRAELREGGV